MTYPSVATPARYFYSTGHLLREYKDPRGITAATTVYDAAGRLLRSERVSPLGGVWQLSLEGLAAGQYAVVLKDEADKVRGTGRLIKH